MIPNLSYNARHPADFPNWTFKTIDFEYEPESASAWMYYKRDAPPCYTFQTLSDMADLRESLKALFTCGLEAVTPVRYFVMASRKPGIFSLGGDLGAFAQAIRKRELETLRAYAHACIDVVYGLVTAFGLPLVSLSVISGQALGGGFEAALSQNFLFAEESARIGVPEVAFNSFPGMGAVSLLSRRLAAAKAEEIIASGRVYSGREMFELGVLDMLSNPGEGCVRARQWMLESGPGRYQRRLALAAARRRCFPVSFEELIRITDLWAICSNDVSARDLRHMERLAQAQQKMLSS
jgi:DSF synthase